MEEKPWLQRADWAEGRITAEPPKGVGCVRITAIIFLLGTAFAIPDMWRDVQAGDKSALALLLMPVISLLLLLYVWVETRRSRKYGSSVLELSRVPGVIGWGIAGVLRPGTVEADEFTIRLSCFRVRSDSDGTWESIVWQDDQRVRALQDPRGHRIVPIAFRVPHDAPPSSIPKEGRGIVWRLDAHSEMPGINYAVKFDVPMYDTGEDVAALGDLDAVAQRVELPTQIAEQGIVVTEAAPVVGITYERWRYTGTMLPVMVVGGVFGGIGVFMLDKVIPIAIAFGFFALFILGFALHRYVSELRVTADSRQILVEDDSILFTRRREIPRADIADVLIKVGITVGSTPYHDLKLVRSDGHYVTVGRAIARRAFAERLRDLILAGGKGSSLETIADTRAERLRRAMEER